MTPTAESGASFAVWGLSPPGRRVILNRNLGHPVYKAGFNKTLGKPKGRGQISAFWKPVGSFEELVLVSTRPLSVPSKRTRCPLIGYQAISAGANSSTPEASTIMQ